MALVAPLAPRETKADRPPPETAAPRDAAPGCVVIAARLSPPQGRNRRETPLHARPRLRQPLPSSPRPGSPPLRPREWPGASEPPESDASERARASYRQMTAQIRCSERTTSTWCRRCTPTRSGRASPRRGGPPGPSRRDARRAQRSSAARGRGGESVLEGDADAGERRDYWAKSREEARCRVGDGFSR